MSWEFAPTFDAAHRAALEGGKALAYVCPPAGWALAPLLDRLPTGAPGGPAVLLLAAEPMEAAELSASLGWIAALRPLYSCQGIARTERLLRAGAARTLVATPTDALALTRRTALKLERVEHVVLAWPEGSLMLGDGPALETLLADARDAQRLIATADDRDPALAPLLAAHAHRAPTLIASRPPDTAGRIPGLRYVVVDDERRLAVTRALLAQHDPQRAIIWDPLPSRFGRWAELARDPGIRIVTDAGGERADLAIATDLPSHEVLAALSQGAPDVVALVRARQVSYLQRLARAARPAPLAGEPDRARDRAAAARRALRERLALGDLDAQLLTLAPLFDEHDPALVAAAALSLLGPARSPSGDAEDTGETVAWVRLFITAGRRDQLRPADLVGALVNEVGFAKDRVGRIEIRDSFSLVEVRAEDADRAIRGLTGATIRGRRIAARPDRKVPATGSARL